VLRFGQNFLHGYPFLRDTAEGNWHTESDSGLFHVSSAYRLSHIKMLDSFQGQVMWCTVRLWSGLPCCGLLCPWHKYNEFVKCHYPVKIETVNGCWSVWIYNMSPCLNIMKGCVPFCHYFILFSFCVFRNFLSTLQWLVMRANFMVEWGDIRHCCNYWYYCKTLHFCMHLIFANPASNWILELPLLLPLQ